MASIREASGLCRLCLSEKPTALIAASGIIDSSLTTKDVEQFTGIQLFTDELISCAICACCTDILHKSVAFRDFCLQNDLVFKQLFSLQLATANDGSDEAKLGQHEILSDVMTVEFLLPEVEEIEYKYVVEEHAKQPSPENATERQEETYSSLASDEEQFNRCDNCSSISHASGNIVPTSTIDTDISSHQKEDDPLNQGNEENYESTQAQDKAAISSAARKKLLCGTCGKLVNNLAYHMQIHMQGVLPYACPHCPTTMADQSNLTRHIEAVHLKKVVKTCEPCGREFTHINSYKSHMRARHGIGETYCCSTCLKTFKHPSGYRKHIAQAHSNERNFSCPVCGKLFKDRQTVKLHEQVHSTERPYGCKVCPKRFKGRSAKRAHELTHEGIAFDCKYCDKTYKYKCLLNIHMKRKHPE
uniref:Protein krueppel n=1 Tax=Anopheles dirus TaxID=7168 RepID=A0A182NPL3_9DIPT